VAGLVGIPWEFLSAGVAENVPLVRSENAERVDVTLETALRALRPWVFVREAESQVFANMHGV